MAEGDLAAPVAPSGTVQFAPGQTEAFVTVRLHGNDTVDAVLPQATLTLSNPTNGMQLGQSTQTITVRDNDAYFAIQADQAAVTEGYAGETVAQQMVFTVTRDSSVSATDTVQWRVSPASQANVADFATGQDALANAGLPSGTVTFSGAEQSAQVTLTLAGDDWFGGDELVQVMLSNPTRGSITAPLASSTILNDDAPYSVAVVGATSQLEGNTPASAARFVFEVSRPADSALSARELLWSVQATGALDPSLSANDFDPSSGQLPTGTVSFTAGQTAALVTVQIAGDSRVEGTEAFVLALADAVETRDSTIAVPLSAPVSVVDDDAAYRIDPVSAIFLEGSGAGAVQPFVFEVQREGYIGNAATLGWEVQPTSSGATVDATDFGGVLPSGEVSFSAGQTTARVTVLVSGDANYEANEAFQVAIGAADEAGMSFTQRTAQGMIFNDEIGLKAVAFDAARPEGDLAGAGGELVFAVQRLGIVQSPSTVDWRVVSGASGPDTGDFGSGQNALSATTLPSGTISFTAGEATRWITLQVEPDRVLEGDEAFTFELSNASVGSEIVEGVATGTIVNDDAQIELDPLTTPASVDEGNGGSQPLVLKFLRAGSTVGTDTVEWALAGVGSDAAAFPADISSPTSGTLTFANGSATALLTITMVADGLEEADKAFAITLGATSTGAALKPGGLVAQTITIVNDDSTVSLAAVTDSVTEGAPGQGGQLVYEVTRTGALREGTASYTVTAGTAPAVNGSDFAGGSLPTGTVSFSAAQTAQRFTLQVGGDYSNEGDERLNVALTGLSPGQSLGATTSRTGTIVNDDTGLEVAAVSASVVEGSGGSGSPSQHVFSITRSGIVTGTTVVDYAVSGLGNAGFAADADDFVGGLPSGTLTFNANETLLQLTFQVNADTAVENDEGYRLTLSNPAGENTDLQVASADGTIVSDDAGLAIEAVVGSIVEGGAGTSQPVRFEVVRTGDLSKVSTVDWALALTGGLTADDLAPGTATSGTLTFTVGATLAQINLPVKGDTVLESDESMSVTLSNPSLNGSFILAGQDSASTLIQDDDDRIDLAGVSVTGLEGASGTTTPFVFRIERDPTGELRAGTVVEWTLSSSMLKPNDFELVAGQSQDGLGSNGGLPSGTVTFSQGETAVTLTVQVKGDGAVERDEAFTIDISSPTANTGFGSTTLNGQVTNDDFGFSVEAVDTALPEGQVVQGGAATGSGTDLVFAITRAGATTSVATVTYGLSGAAGLSAADVVGGFGTPTTLTFASGELVKFVTVAAQGDTTVEADEKLVMTLSNARDVTQGNSVVNIVDATATITVLNDDQRFDARVSGAGTSAAVPEGGAGSTTPLVFEVLRSGAVDAAADVQYAVSGGAGVTADDYQEGLPSGTLSFSAGQTAATVTVLVNGDRLGEADESYTLALSAPTDGSIGDANATVTVSNDDTNYRLVQPADVTEGTGAGTTHVVFTIERVGALGTAGSVQWGVSARGSDDLTAGDFAAGGSGLPSGTASFPAGLGAVNVTLAINRDNSLESDEGLVVTLSNPNQGTLEPGTLTSATAVILSDDDQFSIARAASQQAEIFEGNDPGHKDVVFTVTRSGALRGDRIVSYTVSGTGINAADFDGSPLTSTLTFTDGESSRNITLALKGDSVLEDQETLVVALSNPTGGATLDTGATQAQVVVNNDDARISITATNPSVAEGNTVNGVVQPRTVEFTIVRDGYIYQNSVYSYAVSGVTADDFHSGSLPAGTLSFTNGQTTIRMLTLTLRADSVKEPDDTMLVSLTAQSAGTEISPTAGVATQVILNDDAELNITGGTASALEGDGGHGTAVPFVYTVTRTGATTGTSTVNWSVSSTSNQLTGYDFTTGSAHYTNASSQIVRPSGTLNFTAGQTSATFTFYAYGDTGRGSVEANNEDFIVSLSGPSDGSSVGANSSYTSTILDDDTVVTVTPVALRQAEAIGGATTEYVYTATRSGNLARTSTVSYTVVGQNVYDQSRTEYAADAADFVGGVLPSGSLTFASGSTASVTFTIRVNGDDTVEEDQWFRVALTATSGIDQIDGNGDWASGDNGSVLGEIGRDEAKFFIVDTPTTGSQPYEGDTVVDGGNTATNMARTDDRLAHIFQVDRTLSLVGDAWVDWVVAGGGISGYAAADANDFVDDYNGAFPSGRVTFTDGQSVGFLTIWTKADDVGEFDEALRVYIGAVSPGSDFNSTDGSGYTLNRVILENDDTRFDISASNPIVEGNGFVLTVVRAGDQRGSDVAQWAITFPGSESTNASSGTTSTWYDLDPSDVGANDAAIQAAVTAEGMNVVFDLVNRRLTGEVLFLDGETSKTITISTVDDNLTETWREELPTSIYTDSTRNVTGSLVKLSGTFAAGEKVGVTVDGTLVEYEVQAGDVTSGGNTSAAYSSILAGLSTAVNNTVGSVATARPYLLSTGPGLLVEDDTPFATATFTVTGSGNAAAGSVEVVAEVRADQEVASPGYTGIQWVLDNEPDLVTVSTTATPLYESTPSSTQPGAQTVVVTLTRTDNAATGNLNYPTTVSWRIDGAGAAYDFSAVAGTSSATTYWNGYYQPDTIYGVTSFTAGQLTQLVTLTVTQDASVEDDESFAFNLVDAATAYNFIVQERGPSGHNRDAFAWGTSWNVRRDNYGPANVDTAAADSKASFTVLGDDVRVWFNGDDQWDNFLRFEEVTSPVISLMRSGVLDTDVVIGYTYNLSGRNAEAADFGAGATGSLTLAAQTLSYGTVNYTFTLANFFVDDTAPEGNEDFWLRLTAPPDVIGSHVRLGDAATTQQDIYSQIYDDDTTYAWTWTLPDADGSDNEGNAGASQYTTYSATLTRTAGYMGPATVNWSLAPDYTVSANDFFNDTLPSGSLAFGWNQTAATVTFRARQDLVVESDESFALILTGGTLTGYSPNVTKVYGNETKSTTATLVNDDTGLTISSASGTEVDAGSTTPLVFTIARTGYINETATVGWQATTPGGAGYAGISDFVAASGTVNFAVNQVSATVTVLAQGDNDAEDDEKFLIQIVSATNVEDTSYLSNPGTGTIRNDDSAFSIAADQAQGALESAPHTFTITRTHSTVQNQVVGWQVAQTTGGDDASASDFTGGLVSGNVTFTAGMLSATITVLVSNDATFEFDETYQVNLSLGSGTTNDTLTVASAQGKILNDDTAFRVEANQTSRLEGAGDVVFTVTRVGDLTGASTVQLAITGGSGFNASDYGGTLTASQTLNFAAGDSVQLFTVAINDDNTLEDDETLAATLSSPTGAGLVTNQGAVTVTLANDDATFTMSHVSGAVDADEGSGAARDLVYRVTRAGYADSAGTVAYTVAPSNANDGAASDFSTPLTGNLLFTAGQTERQFTITVAGDLAVEVDESFTVGLSTASQGFAVLPSTQTFTLRNDDTRFDLQAVGPTTVVETDPGQSDVAMVFEIARSGRVTGQEVVLWSVDGRNPDPTSAADFAAVSGAVTFAANAVTGERFTVFVKGDLEGEADETFRVSITGTGLEFGTSSVDGQITDDEASLSVRRHVSGGSAAQDPYEGQTGAVPVVFDVLRSGNVANSVSEVSWQIAGGVDAADFGGTLPSGRVTFLAGETLATVTVLVSGDADVEPDELLVVELSNPSADADVVDARSTATYTVLSDDTSWRLESVSSPASESDTTSGHVFQVVRTGSLYDTTLSFSVSGVGASPADAADFVGGALPSGIVSFTSGQTTSAPFTIQVLGDSQLESSESFEVLLATPSSDGTPRTNVFAVQALTATIVNDDDVLGISAVSTAVTEADTGTSVPVTFTVSREGGLGGTSTVGWRVVDSSTPGESNQADFVTPSGTLTFADGESALTLTLQVKGDLDVEADESFTVELHTPGAGSTITTSTASGSPQSSAGGSIANNDIDLAIAAGVGQAEEGDAQPGVMTFVVTRSGLTSGLTSVVTTVDYAVSGVGGSAANAADFSGGLLPSGTLTFAPGETQQTITVQTSPDGDFESSETFQVLLSNASGNAQIETAAVTGTIVNDDDQLEVVPFAATAAEGTDTQAAPYTDFVFKVLRTGSTIGAASATWTVSPGPGRALTVPDEVQAATGTVSFTHGQSEALVTIGVLADALGEYAEHFLVSLSDPSFGSTVIGSPAQGTVNNDDPVLSITADQVSLAEGNTGAPDTAFVFTVTRTGSTVGSSSAKWAVSGLGQGATVDPVDFGGYLPSGTVIFTDGQVTEKLTVMVLADVAGESDEGFVVTLSEPTNADLLDERLATSVIVNDDTLVSIQGVLASADEGVDGSVTPVSFVLTREGNTAVASSVDWRVQGVSTHQAGPEDFVTGQDDLGNEGLPSGTVSFSAGQVSATLVIQVDGDADFAPDEAFRVALSQPSVGGLRGDPATFTIVNDDSLVRLDTTPGLASEGGHFVFPLVRVATGTALASQVVVGWAVSALGESAASAADFVGGATSGFVTFAAGSTDAAITVQALADTLVERDEQFLLRLVQVPSGNASIDPLAFQTLGAITDEDVGVWVTGLRSQVVEGSQLAGQTPFVVEVHRTGRTDQETVVDLSVTGGASQPAASDDFVSTSLAVTFAAGSTASQFVTLGIVRDALSEADEQFVVSLDAGAGHTVIGEPVYGTIVDDDGTSGNDALYGSASDDLLRGGAGQDTLFGGGGSDRFVFDAPSQGVDSVMDFTADDRVLFVSSAFGGLTIGATQDLAGDLDALLQQLASGPGAGAQADPDVLRINVDGEFQFATGAVGDLDALEAAISAGGTATGPGFVAVGDGSSAVHLYYDADMASGTDGTGLQEIAVLNGLGDAHLLQLQHTG